MCEYRTFTNCAKTITKCFESVIIEQYYDLTPSKRSNVRLNDEIIPKPTHINVGEKQIKVSIRREHPYQSHLSYCAMFPTFQCPDDPDTGVRAASKLPINPMLPATAPQVTLLSKSKGAPFRHELLKIPMETRRASATWPGQNGYQNYIYPKAPNTLCPNLTLRDWNHTLLERTANALRNLEKSQWLTSYQLHFTGTGPSNPIKLDDFNEKTIALITGEMNPYTAQLSERTCPVFLPPRPLEGRRARILQNQRHLENPCPPYSPLFSPEPPDTGLVFTQTHGPLDANTDRTLHVRDTTQRKPYSLKNEVFTSNQVNDSSQTCQVASNNTVCMCELCCQRNCVCKQSELDVTKPHANINKPAFTVNDRGNIKPEPGFGQHTFQAVLQETERNQKELSNRKTMNNVAENNCFVPKCTAPLSAEETDRHVHFEQTVNDFEEEKMKCGSCTIPSIRPRFSRGNFGYGVKTSSRDSGSDLLELQDSFCRTKAHQIFHESLQDASVDLRDNHYTGRKHCFYDFNSYYFH
ncbi:uncharacterized protein C7orf31 [Tachysurus fulvidraco]|uniref:uncharacterized protein C7orf31 n=1 Tax=Tachysurus fulvidraco TaxID=1234273 RepID=UPI001FEFE298|nr:uncharacterized protein C7orf31 [Tachysurus fulvidraco]